MAQGIFMSNLPFGITKEEVLKQLLEYFPELFAEPFQNGNPILTVYKPGQRENGRFAQVATISNIQVDVDALNRKSGQSLVDGKRWVFKKDKGDPRDDCGRWISKMKPQDVRANKKLRGEFTFNPMSLFSESFLKEVNQRVFSGARAVFVLKPDVPTKLLSDMGFVISNIIHTTNMVKIEFSTCMEALQAIVLLNSENVTFCDSSGKYRSECRRMQGLGVNGEVLNIAEIMAETGYIPFEMIHADIFELARLKNYPSQCWRCEKSYTLIGVDACLHFVAGICGCKYITTLDVMSDKRAYFRNDEKFTRLFLNRKVFNDSRSYDWQILHAPLKPTYKDAMEYRNHVAPLLQEDWKTYARTFKENNTCNGKIIFANIVQELPGIPPKTYYSIGIEVPKTEIWSSTNLCTIGSLTLHMHLKKKGYMEVRRPEDRQASLIKIIPSSNHSKVTVVAKMKIESTKEPELGAVTVVPKPIKRSYEDAKYSLNKWIEKPEEYPLFNMIVNSNVSYEFAESYKEAQKDPSLYKGSLTRINVNLNEKQKEALKMTKESVVSVLQGPPGTGKTFTAAQIIKTLSKTERGHILGLAPSNYAADGLAEKIGSSCSTLEMPFRVLRILSKKRERHMIATQEVPDLGTNVTILQDAVRKSAKWLTYVGESESKRALMLSLREKMMNNCDHLLSEDEEELLEAHVFQLEKEIISQFQIIVATASTACDGRIHACSDKVSTVLVDEAGQLTQADTLSLFRFKQFRTVFVGDDKQLKATVQSHSAEISGLGFSVMDWLRLGSSNIPWTMLEEQHRLSPMNRQIVSLYSYNGKLIDAKSIAARDLSKILNFMKNAWPKSPIMSTVVMYDHSHAERMVGQSYVNEYEVNLTRVICNRLIEFGFTANDITVLSLYEAQRKALSTLLSKDNISVRTVDSFQGRENNIVILNMVRGGKNAIGFACNKNRLNVAISRSKFLLFVLCNVNTFKTHQSDAVLSFIDLVKTHGDLQSAENLCIGDVK